MDAINTRKNDEERPIFVVGKKPKSKVVNNKSGFSKNIIKLSHGDQFRGIDELTKVINNHIKYEVFYVSNQNSPNEDQNDNNI